MQRTFIVKEYGSFKRLGSIRATNIDEAVSKLRKSKKYSNAGTIVIEWTTFTGNDMSVTTNRR